MGLRDRPMKITPQLIIMLTGAILIVAGIVILVVNPSPPVDHGQATFDASLRDLRVLTNHIGLAVIFIGAGLEIVGFIGPAIWRGVKKSK
jgi:hypothetical protein